MNNETNESNEAVVKPTCPVCHQKILTRYFFCPNCGNNLKEQPQAILVAYQIGLYAVAIFLPPLGLWPGIKYMMKKGEHAKRVGLITVVLTLISTIITIWAIFSLFGSYMEQLNTALYGF